MQVKPAADPRHLWPLLPAPALHAELARQDSFQTLLVRESGRPALPMRPDGPSAPLELLPAAVDRLPADGKRRVVSAPGHLYVDTGRHLGSGTSAVVSLGIAVGTGELVALKRTTRRATGTLAAGKGASASKNQAQFVAGVGSALAPHVLLDTPGDLVSVDPLMSLDLVGTSSMGLDRAGLAGLAWLTAEGVLPTLLHLHRHHVAHRDIKPANVMQRSTGLHLIDYGLVHWHTSPHYDTTPHYAPPESADPARRAGVDKLDRWTLGVTLLQIAAGKQGETLILTEPCVGWHEAFKTLYGRLREPTIRTAADSEGRCVCETFAAVPHGMRLLILDLMHPNPAKRLDLAKCLKRLEALRVADEAAVKKGQRTELDLAAARLALRARAAARVASFVKPVNEAKAYLLRNQPALRAMLGALPTWLIGHLIAEFETRRASWP